MGKYTTNLSRTQVSNTKSNMDAYTVYCGRKCGRWAESPLGNPFKGPDREHNIAMFRGQIWGKVKDNHGDIRKALVGIIVRCMASPFHAGTTERKTIFLGCWCNEWDTCHCDVIIKLVDWMQEHDERTIGNIGAFQLVQQQMETDIVSSIKAFDTFINTLKMYELFDLVCNLKDIGAVVADTFGYESSYYAQADRMLGQCLRLQDETGQLFGREAIFEPAPPALVG